jgi:hypothetical protein
VEKEAGGADLSPESGWRSLGPLWIARGGGLAVVCAVPARPFENHGRGGVAAPHLTMPIWAADLIRSAAERNGLLKIQAALRARVLVERHHNA